MWLSNFWLKVAVSQNSKNVVPLSNFHYFHWEVCSQLVDLFLSAFRILFDVLHFYNESSAKFFSLTLFNIQCILSYYYFYSITAFNIFHFHASFSNILRISSDLPCNSKLSVHLGPSQCLTHLRGFEIK